MKLRRKHFICLEEREGCDVCMHVFITVKRDAGGEHSVECSFGMFIIKESYPHLDLSIRLLKIMGAPKLFDYFVSN